MWNLIGSYKEINFFLLLDNFRDYGYVELFYGYVIWIKKYEKNIYIFLMNLEWFK